MATYNAKLYTKKGIVTVSISARNEAEAKAHAQKLGRVVEIKKEIGINFSPALSPSDRQIFFARLSAMLSSRVGTSEALRLLRDNFSGKIQEVSSRLLTLVEGGDDLSTAIAKVGSPDFPPATIALIQAGSRSGDTWKALQDAAVFEYELHNVRKSASKGLISGIMGFLFAGVTTVVSTLYLGPKIMESDLIKSASKSVDVSLIQTVGTVMGWIMAVFLILGFVAFLLSGVLKKIMPLQADKIIMKIPYYKDMVLAKNNFIVYYGLALLVRAGVRMEDALRLASEGAPKGALRSDLLGASNAVKKGLHWPSAMITLHPTDRAALASATDRVQIANTLDALAKQYRDLYAQRLATFVPALNMVAALFLSLSGGIMFGMTILPMLQASQGLMGGG